MEAQIPLDPLANGMNNGSSPKWAPILGQWEITETSQGQRAAAHGQLFPMGLAVSNVAMQNGMCDVKMRFSAPFGENMQAGGIVLGYRSGQLENLKGGRDYVLQVSLSGQELRVTVDSVPVIQHLLAHPLQG